MIKLFVALGLAAVAAPEAATPTWSIIGVAGAKPDREVVFGHTVARAGGVTKVVNQFFVFEERYASGETAWTQVVASYDCKARTQTILGTSSFDENGKVLNSEAPLLNQKAEVVNPNSLHDVFLKASCGEMHNTFPVPGTFDNAETVNRLRSAARQLLAAI